MSLASWSFEKLKDSRRTRQLSVIFDFDIRVSPLFEFADLPVPVSNDPPSPRLIPGNYCPEHVAGQLVTGHVSRALESGTISSMVGIRRLRRIDCNPGPDSSSQVVQCICEANTSLRPVHSSRHGSRGRTTVGRTRVYMWWTSSSKQHGHCGLGIAWSLWASLHRISVCPRR